MLRLLANDLGVYSFPSYMKVSGHLPRYASKMLCIPTRHCGERRLALLLATALTYGSNTEKNSVKFANVSPIISPGFAIASSGQIPWREITENTSSAEPPSENLLSPCNRT